MKRWSHFILAYKGALVIAIVTILTSSVYAVYRAKLLASPKEPELAPTKSVSPPDDLEVELITVLPNGFEPVEIVRPAGRFMLVFDNQSRLRALEFHLERSGNAVIPPVHPRGKTDSTKVLNLPAGEYQITEANHPDWKLTLTITKR